MSLNTTKSKTAYRRGRGVVALAVVLLLFGFEASATEHGGSVWPAGAESIAMATAVPRSGQTWFYWYTTFYYANEVDDSHGAAVPISDFKLRVFANAPKVAHNWGVPFFGGQIGSWASVPFLYEELHLPNGRSTKFGIGNCNLVPFTVYYHHGIYHWFYELQFETPGAGYQRGASLNIGQHNMAMTPGAASTVSPRRIITEVGVRADYVINNPDHATHYHSGNEFLTEFDARKELFHGRGSIGAIGYFYQQTTDDTVGGKAVLSTNADGSTSLGNRGRVLDLGVQATLPIGKLGGMAFKWERDTLVRNKPRGNTLWFQFVIPLHH